MPEEALLYTQPITDITVDGVHHIEIFDNKARVIYWRRKLAEDLVTWYQEAVEYALVLPARCLSSDVDRRYRVVRLTQPHQVAVVRLDLH